MAATNTNKSTTFSNFSIGSIWRDGEFYVTITNMDGNVIEYGYPHRRDVFYLNRENFERSFEKISQDIKLSAHQKTQLLNQLRECLTEVKAQNLGDFVYAKMEELGL